MYTLLLFLLSTLFYYASNINNIFLNLILNLNLLKLNKTKLKLEIIKIIFKIIWGVMILKVLLMNQKRKTVVSSGSSRACGSNYNKASVHAEQKAIEFCRKSKSRHLQIFIWRWSKMGKMKSTYCCRSCTQLVNKYGYENDIFTFNDRIKENAVVNNPTLSLAYKIKYGLTDH